MPCRPGCPLVAARFGRTKAAAADGPSRGVIAGRLVRSQRMEKGGLGWVRLRPPPPRLLVNARTRPFRGSATPAANRPTAPPWCHLGRGREKWEPEASIRSFPSRVARPRVVDRVAHGKKPVCPRIRGLDIHTVRSSFWACPDPADHHFYPIPWLSTTVDDSQLSRASLPAWT